LLVVVVLATSMVVELEAVELVDIAQMFLAKALGVALALKLH
jgi:hypothetical protein